MQIPYLAAFATAAAFIAAPAFADGTIHSAATEMGYTVHPDHAQTGKTREEVRAELEAARNSPAWASMRVGVTPTQFRSTLTREQVEADLLRAQQHPSWSARRVGAPVTMP